MNFDFVILIPFNKVTEIKPFAEKWNVEQYSIMYIPARNKELPKKFVIVIEKWNEKYINSFIRKNSLFCHKKDYLYIKDKEKLEHIEKYYHPKGSKISRKLINEGYIFVSVDIDKPVIIFKVSSELLL